jgi:CheY-like chemotaxis protein
MAALADNISEMFRTLLDISRIDMGVLETHVGNVALGPIFESVERQLQLEASERGLSLRIWPTRLSVSSDGHALERIVINLARNAVRHTRQGKVIVHARRRGDSVRIEVWDSGPGIPEDKRQAIFDEFVQLEPESSGGRRGIGLGLAIVHRLTQMLHHPLAVDSVEGRGTRFTVTVPLAQSPVTAAPPPAGGALSVANGLVLVVDDHDAERNAVQDLLVSWHCRTLTAADVGGALRAIDASPLLPDAVLCDLRLGDDNGIRAVAEIRARLGYPVPAVIVTGDLGTEGVAEIEASGMPHLYKPVLPEQLRNVLGKMIADGRAMTTSS